MQCSIGSQCISTGHSNVEEVTKPIQVEEMAGMALEEEIYIPTDKEADIEDTCMIEKVLGIKKEGRPKR